MDCSAAAAALSGRRAGALGLVMRHGEGDDQAEVGWATSPAPTNGTTSGGGPRRCAPGRANWAWRPP
ncbi:hypothetical protein EDD41_2810 [Luteococcus japonicus]|uniref:Uncharacterized protein n=1 Tax=Luteococcus japonicus TaxID=33984 RepID=A0A3N1ZXF7_9ACTN|nr:hypothetical protein EDD41_2810 [Luteococcus japonicus]